MSLLRRLSAILVAVTLFARCDQPNSIVNPPAAGFFKLKAKIGGNRPVENITISRDGSRILTDNYTTLLWDVEDRVVLREWFLCCSQHVMGSNLRYAVDYAPTNGRLTIRRIDDGSTVFSEQWGENPPHRMEISDDSERLLLMGPSNEMSVLGVQDASRYSYLITAPMSEPDHVVIRPDLAEVAFIELGRSPGSDGDEDNAAEWVIKRINPVDGLLFEPIRIPALDRLTYTAYTSDGNSLLILDDRESLSVINLSTGSVERSIPLPAGVWLHVDGPVQTWAGELVLLLGNQEIVALRVADGAVVSTIVTRSKITRYAVSHDGGRLVTTNAEGIVSQWLLPCGTFEGILRPAPTTSTAISQDASVFYFGTTIGGIHIRDRIGSFGGGILRRSLQAEGLRTVSQVLVSHDERFILSIGSDETCEPFCDPDSPVAQTLSNIPMNRLDLWRITDDPDVEWEHINLTDDPGISFENIKSATYTRDGKSILVGDENGSIRRIRVSDGSSHRMYTVDGAVAAVAIAPGGRYIAAGVSNSVYIWDTVTGTHPVVKTTRGHDVQALQFTPDGSSLLSGGSDGVVRSWRTVGGQQGRSYRGHNSAVTGIAIDPLNGYVVSSGEDNKVVFWDLASGGIIEQLDDAGQIGATPLSIDGEHLVTHLIDGRVGVWTRRVIMPMPTVTN
jgi:WD40 repeat protein